ncbi:MAG: hypothetical protein Fur0025_21540 [Oscillatoriaceae cyanobacterium]
MKNHNHKNFWSSWSVYYIPEWICKHLKINPGEYKIKYNIATGDLIIQDSNDEEKEYRVNLYNLLSNSPSQEALELLQKKKNYKRLGNGFCNHHIIPHQLCQKHPLIGEATRYGVFNKDGNENLMPLPAPFHVKKHSEGSPYYTLIKDILDDQWARIIQDGLETDPDEIKRTILEIIATTRDYLNELLQVSGSTIRDDFLSPDYSDDLLPKK